jgi:fucose 4-O-acetylase-like acetyltransferase
MTLPATLADVGVRAPSSTRTASDRTEWIDIARGMAELSVVTFHILQALTNAGLTPAGLFDFWTPVGDMIRMPLMMLLAGLFLERSMAKGARPFFAGKAKRVLWPFLVWAYIYSLYWYLKPSAYDSRTTSQLLLTVLDPGSHLWFLQALFLYYVIAYFLVRRSLMAAYSVAILLVATIPWTGEWIESRLTYLFLFFLLGVQLARFIRTHGFPFNGWVALALVGLGVVLPIMTDSMLGPSKYTPYAVPASIVGVLAALVIARLLVHVPGVRQAFMLFGRYSLEIYCAHVIFSSATRQVLVGLGGITDFWALFLLCSMAGLFMPVALAVALRRLGVDVAFEWPKWDGLPGVRQLASLRLGASS